MYKAEVKVPGSCGELAQGLINNTNIMITCPINLFSRVSVAISENFYGVTTNIQAEKTVLAVQKLLTYLGKDKLGVRINIDSQLMRAKGMASSTADITGAIVAVMSALNYEPDLQIVKKIALEVEPTDGTFLPGINYFDYIAGNIARTIGEPPRLDILIFCEEGQINTLSFNKMKGLHKKKKAKENLVREAVAYIKKGLNLGNKELIGKGATISTIAHQKILYKPYLKTIINMIDKLPSVYGVNTAHSGKLLGLIVDREDNFNSLINDIERNISVLNYFQRVSIISGGIRHLRKEKEHVSCSWRKH